MKKIVLFTFILTIFTVIACKDFLEKENPNELTTSSYFKTEAQAIAAVNAIYGALQANNLYEREYFFLQDCLSDDVQSGGAQLEAPRAQVINHVFDGSNKLVNDNWQGWYRVILRANFAIANLPNAEGISAALKTRLLGEAYYLRGWAYFELVSLWGGVPIYTEPSTSPTGKPRSTEAEVYSLILSDLNTAETNLPLKSAIEAGRASKGAAQALKGKVHMFRGNYNDAKTELLKVVNSNEYSLVNRYLDNFETENEFNSESIFEVLFQEEDGGNSGAWNGSANEGNQDITFRGQEYSPTPGSWRNTNPNQSLVNEYEPGDPRYDYNFYKTGDTYNNGTLTLNIAGVGWRKYTNAYKRATEDFQSGINFRVIRLADVYLMLAEAENEINGPNATALGYLNMTRNRADVSMPNYPTVTYPTVTKAQMFAAIVHERRVELAGEQIRNRDIRRWRRQSKLASEPLAAYQAKYDLLPIPISELSNNSALTSADQNPGY